MLTRDVLFHIALQIDNLIDWYAFSLVCRMTAKITSEIAELKKLNNAYYVLNRTRCFFTMSLKPTSGKSPSRDQSREVFLPHVGQGVITGDMIVSAGPPVATMCGVTIIATKQFGEGVVIKDKGAQHKMTTKRYNDTSTWCYRPINPSHWGGFAPPTSMSEALDRIAGKLVEMSGSKIN